MSYGLCDQFQKPIDLNNPITIAELHQKYPIVEWIKLIRRFIPEDAPLPSNAIVIAPKFIQGLTDWLVNSASRDDGVTIENMREFFIIKTIFSEKNDERRITYEDFEFEDSDDDFQPIPHKPNRDLYRNITVNISSGTTEFLPRSLIYIRQSSNKF
ncbi:hypothetical protein BDF21DRAFT_493053 [Thamnidium elegans]|nr:hypothetical protein BDF21DRAFT_493053 [Thamnidium elegans]